MGFVESQWNVANSYYFRSIASIQQLWRAASSPSGDLSSGEVQASQRFSEHIMYLQQLQRRVVHSAWEVEDALVRTSNLLASLAPTGMKYM